MTEVQKKFCQKIMKKHGHVLPMVMRYGYSLEIESRLIMALVKNSKGHGIEPQSIKGFGKESQDSFFIQFTTDKLPPGLFFQFFIYGFESRTDLSTSVWLVLASRPKQNRRLAKKFSKFVLENPEVFHDPNLYTTWNEYHDIEIIGLENDELDISKRVVRIIEKWEWFIHDELPKLTKKIELFKKQQ